MKRRLLLAAICAGCVSIGAAHAQGFADQIVRQLQDQGFVEISVTNTWLGRTRILAQSGDGQREIILNASTGEILRDLYAGRGSGLRIVRDGTGTSGPSGNSGSDDDDDDDDDEDDEDEDDDDSSGHGGGSDDSDDGDDDND